MQATDESLWHCKQASFSHVSNTDKTGKKNRVLGQTNGLMWSIHCNNYIRGNLSFHLHKVSTI